MDRRTALKSFIALVGSTAVGSAAPRFQWLRRRREAMDFGWFRDDTRLARYVASERLPFLAQQNGEIKGSGKGKRAFLHLAFEKVTNKDYVPHHQDAPDCTSQAFGLGIDFLAAVQIATKRMPQLWKAKAATEPIYGGARVEIGGGRQRMGGATGHWAAKWVSQYGVLHRQKYGSHDFTTYDPAKAILLGKKGCPDELEAVAKKHPVKKTAIVKTYDDLCDAIYNGSPVVVCSTVGFGPNYGNKRDKEGFLTQRRIGWNHAMLFGGYDDEYKRPGALCFQSWGPDWISGPTRHNQPAGTFWIDKRTVNRMLAHGDSHALSAYEGFPRVRDIPAYILH
jgi:hypothetical protein